MTSSARGCVDEPIIYGPLRLIESIEKIITIIGEQGISDDFLLAEREKIENNKLVVMEDEEAFVELLDELVLDFTKALKTC
jgi:hypothetical protein